MVKLFHVTVLLQNNVAFLQLLLWQHSKYPLCTWHPQLSNSLSFFFILNKSHQTVNRFQTPRFWHYSYRTTTEYWRVPSNEGYTLHIMATPLEKLQGMWFAVSIYGTIGWSLVAIPEFKYQKEKTDIKKTPLISSTFGIHHNDSHTFWKWELVLS